MEAKLWLNEEHYDSGTTINGKHPLRKKSVIHDAMWCDKSAATVERRNSTNQEHKLQNLCYNKNKPRHNDTDQTLDQHVRWPEFKQNFHSISKLDDPFETPHAFRINILSQKKIGTERYILTHENRWSLYKSIVGCCRQLCSWCTGCC